MSKEEYQIKDYDYIGSTIGNAFFSGVSYSQLWECVRLSSNREELDASVDATIKMNKLLEGENDE